MQRLLAILPLVLLLTAYPAAAGERTAGSIERFVPEGWEPTQSAAGDLNGDGIKDLAVVVERSDEAEGDDIRAQGSRGLLVLFGKPDGGYRFQAFAPDALPCAYCLGAMGAAPGTPAFELRIANRELSVGWIRGSRETTAVKLVIAYDAKRNQLGLLGDEVITTDRLTGKTTIQHRNYATGTLTVNGSESRLEPRFIPIIEVSAEDY
jgi:hypothetical protein